MSPPPSRQQRKCKAVGAPGDRDGDPLAGRHPVQLQLPGKQLQQAHISKRMTYDRPLHGVIVTTVDHASSSNAIVSCKHTFSYTKLHKVEIADSLLADYDSGTNQKCSRDSMMTSWNQADTQ